MESKTCNKVHFDREIVTAFTEHLISGDLKSLQAMLSENGIYDIQTPRLNTLQVNKKRFTSWIKKRLKNQSNLTATYDQCTFCSLGSLVILINKGCFPCQIKDSSQRSKTGLMIEVTDGLISRIKFCYVFLKTENNYVFENEIERKRNLGYYGTI